MKLFLKRNKSAEETQFFLYDESGNERYRTENKKTRVTSKLNMIITDSHGSEAARIRQLPIAHAAFVIKVNRTHITFIALPTSKGIYSYFYGNNWHINGDIASKNFEVINVDKSVVFSHRSEARCCAIEIFDEPNELYCVAASICANLINIVNKPAVKAANI